MNHRVGLAKAFKFEAAHKLPHYIGKCAELHGHSYHGFVEVSAILEKAQPSGVVVDFDVLKGGIEACVLKLDHTYLNDTFPAPTAELMVAAMYDALVLYYAQRPECNAVDMVVERVRLYETETCYAEYPYFSHNEGLARRVAHHESIEAALKPLFPAEGERSGR